MITLTLGPLVEYDITSRTAVLAGIVSFGYGCGQVGAAAVYAKVDHYLPWINNLINEYSH